MRTFSKIMLVLLVVAFPLASWYYLQTGLNYRKKALRELTPKGEWEYATTLGQDKLRGKTTVVFKDASLEENMATIYKQYNSGNTFQMIQVNSDTTIARPWHQYHLEESLSDAMFVNNKLIYLIDTALQLRYTYIQDKFEMKKLVEHIAIALPREKDPDIKMIKNAEK